MASTDWVAIGSVITTYGRQTRDRRQVRAAARGALHQAGNTYRGPEPLTAP